MGARIDPREMWRGSQDEENSQKIQKDVFDM